MRIMARILGLAGLLVLLASAVCSVFWITGAFPDEGALFMKFSAIALLFCGLVLFAGSRISWRIAGKDISFRETLSDKKNRFPDFIKRAGFGLGVTVITLVAYFAFTEYFESYPWVLVSAIVFFMFSLVSVSMYFLWELSGYLPFRESRTTRKKKRNLLQLWVTGIGCTAWGVAGIVILILRPYNFRFEVEFEMFKLARILLLLMTGFGIACLIFLRFKHKASEPDGGKEVPEAPDNALISKLFSRIWTVTDFGLHLFAPPAIFSLGMALTEGIFQSNFFWGNVTILLFISLNAVFFLMIAIPNSEIIDNKKMNHTPREED